MKRTTWTINVAVDFWTSKKAVMAGRDGRDQFLASIAWSTEERTDGFVPVQALDLLAGWVGISTQAAKKAAKRLVEVGMWETVDGGWRIHDYRDWQYTAAEREKLQQDRAERQKRHREAKRHASRNALHNAPDPPESAPRNTLCDGVYSRQSKPLEVCEQLSSSSRGVRGDDDDGSQPPLAPAAQAAIDALAARDLAERESTPGLRRIGDVDAWLDRARRRKRSELGERVQALAVHGLDGPAIVAALAVPTAPPLLAAVPTPPTPEELASRALCPECEMPAHPGRPHPIEPWADAR